LRARTYSNKGSKSGRQKGRGRRQDVYLLSKREEEAEEEEEEEEEEKEDRRV
jgi:hypothetical protein